VRALNLVGYTKKQFTEIAAQRHTLWNTWRTAEFLEWRAVIKPEHLSFFDESGWELDKQGVAQTGWGPEFQRLYNTMYKKLKGKHYNLPLLCTTSGILHWDFVPGSYGVNACADFFEAARLAVLGSTVRYIQMDNCKIHNNVVVDKVRSLRNADGLALEVVFQPTYSPHLNPVEMVFGYLKQLVARDSDLCRQAPLLALNSAMESLSPGILRGFALHCGVF
jgi:hypothetical protein